MTLFQPNLRCVCCLLGETSKLVTLLILDDSDPEDNESIEVALTYTEGGSRILPSSNTVTIVILANDNVAGIIGFQTASRSVIGREGEHLTIVIFTLNGWRLVGCTALTGDLFF